MLNEKEKNIILSAVNNVGGYPIFPDQALHLLNIKDNRFYREYLFEKLLDYRENNTNLSDIDKKNIAACLYLCIQYMDENDAGAVMDCNLADIKEAYAKIIKEWDINEVDYKPMLDKLKEEVQKKID